jgi:WD40 repeat protein
MHRSGSGGLAFSPDSQSLAVGALGPVGIFDLSTMKLSVTLGKNAMVRGAIFAPQGQYLAVSDSAGIKLWDLRSGAPWSYLRATGDRPSLFQFSPDGRLLTATYGSYQLRMWELDNGRVVKTLPLSLDNRQGSTWEAFSDDGTLLAYAGLDGMTKIWNLFSGKEMLTLHITLQSS